VKHLPKHLQPRWRYLAVGIETWPETSLTRGAFQRELWYAAQNLVGDAGSADADLTVLRFEHAGTSGETVVRTRRDEVERARAVVACVDEVGGDPVGLRVRGVSGTVRACEERYLGRAAGEPDERRVVFEEDRRSAFVSNRLADVRTSTAFLGATELDFE
jgi:ribonuclease P/MRP protein subunit POP5